MARYATDEPIYALATPYSPSALAVIRASGSGVLSMIAPYFSASILDKPSLSAIHGYIKDKDGSLIDEVVAIKYAKGHGYTSEEAFEIMCHGSLPVIRRISRLLESIGIREAERGEFTYRAFMHGRLDLTAAEAVEEIVSARSERAGAEALSRLSGSIRKEAEAAKDAILDILASVEVQLDYGEDDVPEEWVFPSDRVNSIISRLSMIASTYSASRLYSHGASVVLIGRTNAGKSSLYNAILKDVEERHKKGQPVLLGTISVEDSEILSRMLKMRGIPHNVLNAKNHQHEAEIVARAGQIGAVTVATNMAGRGTDIKLGSGVAELGGLHVIGSSRHDSRRIDRQLRGRCSRQGDPGSSKFYVSLEDNLMRLFGSDRIVKIFDRFGLEEGDELQHPWLNKSIETAQRRVEQHHFAIRKRTLDFDDVMNKQREIIYGLRKDALLSENPHDVLFGIIEQNVETEIANAAGAAPEGRDKDGGFQYERLVAYLNQTFPLEFKADQLTEGFRNGRLENPDALTIQIVSRIENAYADRNAGLPEEQVQYLERHTVLEAIDRLWQEHLYAMDGLRSSMSLRVYAQKDPLVEYKQEAYKIFTALMDQIYHDVANNLFRVTVTRLATLEEILASMPQELIHQAFPQFAGGTISVNSPDLMPGIPTGGALEESVPAEPEPAQEEVQITFKRSVPKVGRNDECPCGSGKKYKKCCGRE